MEDCLLITFWLIHRSHTHTQDPRRQNLRNVLLPLAAGGSTFLGMGTGTTSSATCFLGGSGT